MFKELLSYFQHPMLQNPYIKFGVVVATFAVASIIVSFIFKKVIKKLTSKTQTDVDDKLLAKLQMPIIYLIILIGMNVGFYTLGLAESTLTTIEHVMNTIYILVVTYVAIVVADIIIEAWGDAWAKKTESTLDDALLPLFHRAAKIILVMTGLMFVLSEWNIDITGILAGVGIAGIAIGFAVKDSLANIFGGLSVILDRAISVGDVIELDDGTSGTVTDVGLRSTRIRNWDNELVVVPNGKISNSKILNKKLPDLSIRIVVPFGVEYGSDIEKVKKIVSKAIEPIEEIITKGDRKPTIMFKEMGASALNFKAYLWVDNLSKKFSTEEKIKTAIYNALNKAGIVIPYQTFTVYTKKQK